MTPTVRACTDIDRDAVHHAFASAFLLDPVFRLLYPTPLQYMTYFPNFTRAWGDRAFELSTAFCLEGCIGAALWLPPGEKVDEEAVVSHLEKTIDEAIQPAVFKVLEELDDYHPEEPHWHLALLGVDSFHQSKGHGSTLLMHTLSECDRKGESAYLESTNPRNVPFYERHGFILLDTLQEDDLAPVFPMLRRPS